jgi:hypothetical protein
LKTFLFQYRAYTKPNELLDERDLGVPSSKSKYLVADRCDRRVSGGGGRNKLLTCFGPLDEF